MKKILLGLLGIIALLAIILWAMGPMQTVLSFLKPSHSFESEQKITTPDYSKVENWAALPQTEDLADYRPASIAADASLKEVDVFFIHPTGYLKGEYWNSRMDVNTATEENTSWMMANQASAFSDCNVYAPRYREATIFSFFDLEGVDEKAALAFAYKDVEQAFDYYLQHYNKGKPFIIASHSQGSYHALPLIQNKIDGTSLANRMIAAYTIGINSITDKAVKTLSSVTVCDAPAQTNCIIHWATYREGATVEQSKDFKDKPVCVNPLTWKRDGGRADKVLHKGYVKTSGAYDLAFHGSDEANQATFPPLEAPIKAHTFATCKDGFLYVDKQDFPSFIGEGNYHGLDFQLFHLDIRENVSLRVREYFKKKSLLTMVE